MSKEREYVVVNETANSIFAEETGDVHSDNPQATATERLYTQEDVNKFREQEKSKLYPEIKSLKDELALLRKSEEDRARDFESQRAAAEAEAKRKEEDEMGVRELLTRKEQEWQERLRQESQERERAFALLEKERAYSELTHYIARRTEEERENIMPDLLDMISGGNVNEVEESIANLRSRSARIMDATRAAMQDSRREMTGSRVTAPPSGPLDTNSEQSQFTAEQISAMSVTEFAKNRNKLLGKAASERGKGLFG